MECFHLLQRLSQIESQAKRAVTDVHRQFGDTVTFQVCRYGNYILKTALHCPKITWLLSSVVGERGGGAQAFSV